MAWFVRLAAASIISIGIAFSLSLLPQLEDKGRMLQEDRSVFQPQPTMPMTSETAVNELAKLPLHSEIRRVDWSSSILSVDLLTKEERMTEELYEDLGKLAQLGIMEKQNVKGVLVRVLEDPSQGGSNQLLVAMEASRSHLSEETLTQLREKKLKFRELLGKEIPLNWGPKWRPET
ncbi:hypothetical protein [Paenibacillus turpanensis]|uniref:hypothetical protein n=1 Tax=Paenibacillus turpanensis TaxID=2689078 RepID=UPI00140D06C4|nr:hypothetical protein [Paenibacillus turpanensis]